MTEEKIAALDSDWAEFTPAEQAAYALARKLTYEPQSIADADIDALRKHYKDLQILEMIVSVSGNNSTNRWKDGVGSPQSKEGGSFGKKSKDSPANDPMPREPPAVLKSFLTPTAEKYKTTVTKVAPLQIDEKTGTPSPRTVSVRPPLESRAAVEKALKECSKRTPRLPLVDDAPARALLPEDWPEGPLPQWVRLLANFPVDGKSRIAGFRSAEINGDLTPLFKAQLSWIIARQDRAWYAVGLARQRLKELGWSDDKIYQLDGDWQKFPLFERALFTVARNLAASPIVLTDDDVARAVELAGPREVVQVISYTTSRSCFNRITEAAGLQLEHVGAQPPTEESSEPPTGEPKTPPIGEVKGPPGASSTDWIAMAKALENTYAGKQSPESVRMLIAIARGSQMGPGEGWFGPAQTRYDWDWLLQTHGKDAAKGIAKEQFRGKAQWFARLDRNQDGRITADDLDWSANSVFLQQAMFVNGLFRRMNQKGDGRLTQDDLLAFFKQAANGKDYLTADDLRGALLMGGSGGGGGGGFAPGDAPTPEVLLRGLFRGEIGSLNEGPAVNDPAPDFTLKTQDGKQTVRLSELRGAKPIVLVFGNFTCGPFRSVYPYVDELRRRYQDDAIFLSIYVREAHPTDGWHMESNAQRGVKFAQPTTYDQRVAVAQQCQTALKFSMPLLVDEINDPVGHAYSGMPARFYVIDPDGKVAYKSGRGPFGLKPAELEQALLMALLEQSIARKKTLGSQKQPTSFVPLLDNAAAWRHLPPVSLGAGQPLPAWARATAETLPRTTAAMLELDYLHRAGSPLDPRLRGMMRWSAAHANRCAFTETQALADLRLAGVGVEAIDALTRDPRRLSPDEQAAVEFARKLTSAAYTVTDEEMAQLIKTHGEKQVVAMVQLLAHANFQDRLIHALGAAAEEPLLPLPVVFDKKTVSGSTQAPPRKTPTPPPGPEPASRITDPEWLAFDYDALQKRLGGQKAREPRIRVPTSEELNKQNPDAPPQKIGIRWSLVCSGYQPKLAQGWSACTRAFGEEAQQNRAFEELQFWVVTRSLNCFY